ncbi:MAG: hypothetical protein ABJB02_10630, partial [Dokdonella sp.]
MAGAKSEGIAPSGAFARPKYCFCRSVDSRNAPTTMVRQRLASTSRNKQTAFTCGYCQLAATLQAKSGCGCDSIDGAASAGAIDTCGSTFGEQMFDTGALLAQFLFGRIHPLAR